MNRNWMRPPDSQVLTVFIEGASAMVYHVDISFPQTHKLVL